MKKTKDVNGYISNSPIEVQEILEQLRALIRKTAPLAEEIISYGMPAYELNGILVYFAPHKNHIGFYPTASGIEAFKKELSVYKWSKGAVQFPIDKPLPIGLVAKIVEFRVKENMQKAKMKK